MTPDRGDLAQTRTDQIATFDDTVASLRNELVAHAYRMLGSWDDAEDAVQETQLKAWRAWDGFDHRSSVRTWLHRIAINVCLDALRSRSRRVLPLELRPDVDLPTDVDAPERWVQPAPGDGDDLRLAFIAALQLLGPRQRAVFLLREVLDFSAADVALMLDTTVAAVKSSLQRARSRLGDGRRTPDDVVEPLDPVARRLLDAYITAFQSGEVAPLLAVLRADASLELMPSGDCFRGRDACASVFEAAVGTAGEWAMQPTVANGQPAALVTWKGGRYGVAVLDARVDGIARVSVFEGAAFRP
ncbi:RNA polymerase subunit sigma-70 [Planctomonas sp. JC2975]|uniref:RNA polymerase subunit sigma-70 n=1 Tax=Planctomonas sp. JC2975 TaxID=2729626 RepID=UPI00197C9C2C